MSIQNANNVQLPIPIYLVAHRYFVYNVTHVSYLRCEHRILGVLVGTLPQSPQQNVFGGLPVELLPEEARLLVEKGIARVIDDHIAHRKDIASLEQDTARKRRWLAHFRAAGTEAAKRREDQARERTAAALSKIHDREQATAAKVAGYQETATQLGTSDFNRSPVSTNSDDSLFPAYERATFNQYQDDAAIGIEAKSLRSDNQAEDSQRTLTPYGITPSMSSYTTNLSSIDDENCILPKVPSSYALFKHLHSGIQSSNYYMTPGLRFGCQYSVYPGDPLRFHSHFLAVGKDWDEEIDLLAIVGGGRLGTGVKKGFLLGGVEPSKVATASTPSNGHGDTGVRCFCLEWGGM